MNTNNVSSVNNNTGYVELTLNESDETQSSQSNRVSQAARKSICRNLMEGMARSRILRAIVITVATCLLVAFLVSNPVGWMVAALGISALAAKAIFFTTLALATFALCALPAKGIQKMSAELSTLTRLSHKEPYSQIPFDEVTTDEGIVLPAIRIRGLGIKPNVHIGGLPNQLSRKWNDFFNTDQETRSQDTLVVSFNEEWEREPIGFSVPFRKEDYKSLGISSVEITTDDHAPITESLLNQAADHFYNFLFELDKQGKLTAEILSHCLGGSGRSTAGYAAFLMKYGMHEDETPLSIEEICLRINHFRKGTIWNKLVALSAYDAYLKTPAYVNAGMQRPVQGQEFQEVIAELQRTKKKKTSKQQISHLCTALRRPGDRVRQIETKSGESLQTPQKKRPSFAEPKPKERELSQQPPGPSKRYNSRTKSFEERSPLLLEVTSS